MTRRPPRCTHGMLAGFCTVPQCPHFDGVRTCRDMPRLRRTVELGAKHRGYTKAERSKR